MSRSERGLRPRNRILGGGSEGGRCPPPSVLEDADGRHDVSTDESEGLEHQPMVARDVAHHHLLEAQPAIVPEPLDHGVRAAYEELGLARAAIALGEDLVDL